MNTASRFKLVDCKVCGGEIRLSRKISNRRYYCKACRNSPQELNCDRCGGIYTGLPKTNKNHYCGECVNNNTSDLAGISSRTLSKIWNRAKLPCAHCGWDECNCDVHHITPVCESGLDNLANLVVLCPCCHRKAHRGLLQKDYLLTISLKDFDISLYYNKELSKSRRINKDYYSDVDVSAIDKNDLLTMSGSEISKKYGINKKNAIKLRREILGFARKRKFDNTKEELEILIKIHPMIKVAKMLGVSGNAVKKRCRLLGIELKDMRGYWAKLAAGKIVEV